MKFIVHLNNSQLNLLHGYIVELESVSNGEHRENRTDEEDQKREHPFTQGFNRIINRIIKKG